MRLNNVILPSIPCDKATRKVKKEAQVQLGLNFLSIVLTYKGLLTMCSFLIPSI